MGNQKSRTMGKKAGATAMMAALVLGGGAGTLSAGAAETVRVSEKEYNLVVEDLPEGVEEAYAKFHDGSLPAGNYMLSLFDGYDAMVQMEDALTAAGEELSGLEYQAIEATVYEKDEEGDYYPLDGMPGVTLICPVPEVFGGNASKVQVMATDEKGALYRISSKIVSVNGQDCVMFDLSGFTTYAFLYKSSGTLTSGKQPTPTPAPAKAKPTKAPEKTPTPKPTKAAEKTPTPEPTKAAGKSTPAPTKAPAKAGATAGGSSASAPKRDQTPQTGDSFPQGRYYGMLAAGGMLAGIGYILRRKK